MVVCGTQFSLKSLWLRMFSNGVEKEELEKFAQNGCIEEKDSLA